MRESITARKATYCDSRQEKLFVTQSGLCSYCKTRLVAEQIQSGNTHIHHMKPQQFGGTHQLRNLKLLHTEYHRTVHALFSRKQMSKLRDQGIDYLRMRKKRIIVEEGESVVR